MNAKIKTALTILACAISLLFMALLIDFVHAEDYLSGQLIVDFPKEEARYTESHSFGVQMSASVAENDCNRCLRDNSGSECLDVCEEVILTY